MSRLVIKKSSGRYYFSVLFSFGLCGGIGSALLYGGFLFWPMIVLMLFCIALSVVLKDGRYYEFDENQLDVVGMIPFWGRNVVKTMKYDDIDEIVRKEPRDGPGGIGIWVTLNTGEKYLLNTGFMPQDKVEQGIQMVHNYKNSHSEEKS